MRWGSKHLHPAPTETNRWYPWFAWVPVRLRNGNWVWLEKVARLLVAEWTEEGYVYYWIYDPSEIHPGIVG